MSTTYKVISGDTFELISRKEYGTQNDSDLISRANPGVTEPLTSGITITIPDRPFTPPNLQQVTNSTGVNEVSLLIDDQRFRFWTTIKIIQSMDSISIVSFEAPFDADAPGFRDVFRPLSFKPCVITVGGEPLFNGTIQNIIPIIETASKTITVDAYSLPGVLNDCTPPSDYFLNEFNDQTFEETIRSLLEPFGIALDFQSTDDLPFDRIAIEPGERILKFIIKLLKQRNLLMTDSPRGELVIYAPGIESPPVAKLEQGVSPLLTITPSINSQNYYSHVTGIEPVIVGLRGSQFTVKNSFLEGVVRPLSFNASDTLDSTLPLAVNAKFTRMFANVVSYTVQLNTWRDPNGDPWRPGTMIMLVAPDAMIYNDYSFLIRSVTFEKGPRSETVTLELILPGSFSGQIPITLPWD